MSLILKVQLATVVKFHQMLYRFSNSFSGFFSAQRLIYQQINGSFQVTLRLDTPNTIGGTPLQVINSLHKWVRYTSRIGFSHATIGYNYLL